MVTRAGWDRIEAVTFLAFSFLGYHHLTCLQDLLYAALVLRREAQGGSRTEPVGVQSWAVPSFTAILRYLLWGKDEAYHDRQTPIPGSETTYKFLINRRSDV